MWKGRLQNGDHSIQVAESKFEYYLYIRPIWVAITIR